VPRAALMDAAVAGYSVGELAAFACAGVLSLPTAIALAVPRAALMDAAVAGLQTGLLSVSGLSQAQVLQAQPALQCAIDIGAQQGIYAAEVALLDASAAVLTARGGVCQRLEVRVASHSRFMEPAAQAFAAQLEGLAFARAQVALVANVSGRSARDPLALRGALSAQLAHTVRWADCMDALAEQGVACVMEIGAGSSLAKMWNKRHAAIPARALSEFRDAAGAARWLQRTCTG
jgi:[acyl-carrier-protein] S-malonyltransferase